MLTQFLSFFIIKAIILGRTLLFFPGTMQFQLKVNGFFLKAQFLSPNPPPPTPFLFYGQIKI